MNQPIQLQFSRVTVSLPPRSLPKSLPEHMEQCKKDIKSLAQRCLRCLNTAPPSADTPPQPPHSPLETADRAASSSSPRHFDPRLSSTASPSASRVILRSVSGYAAPGQLLAIMGGSGSGKTTLLNVLAGRLKNGRGHSTVSGDLLLNGRIVDATLLSCVSAYVMQDDVLMPVMTAREHIQWSADMRLPHTASSPGHTGKVDDILAELGLTRCADVPVGTNAAGDGGGQGGGGVGEGGLGGGGGVLDSDVVQSVVQLFRGARRGLSGGEQRRVSIGMELVTDPMLLFIDGQSATHTWLISLTSTLVVVLTFPPMLVCFVPQSQPAASTRPPPTPSLLCSSD